MEGVGARLGRTSSRYNSGPATAAVFSGRVRKWKKKWVRVSTSSVGVFRASKANNSSTTTNSPHHLLLHKWTPLSAEEPPSKRFRYAPIAMLEHTDKEIEAVAEETDLFDTDSPKSFVQLDMNLTHTDQIKQTKPGFNLGLCLNSQGTEQD